MLTAQTKYALRALIHLQRANSEGYLRVEEVAEHTDLPAPFLSKILKTLTKEGVVESRRGKNGGVRLASGRKAASLYEVCQAMQDPLVREECLLLKKACDAKAPCPFHGRWDATKQKFLRFLKATTLSSSSLGD